MALASMTPLTLNPMENSMSTRNICLPDRALVSNPIRWNFQPPTLDESTTCDSTEHWVFWGGQKVESRPEFERCRGPRSPFSRSRALWDSRVSVACEDGAS